MSELRLLNRAKKMKQLKNFALVNSLHVHRTCPGFTLALKTDVLIRTTLEKFENAASLPRFGHPSMLIRHENGAFRKRSSNRRDLKTLAFYFRVDGEHFQSFVGNFPYELISKGLK